MGDDQQQPDSTTGTNNLENQVIQPTQPTEATNTVTPIDSPVAAETPSATADAPVAQSPATPASVVAPAEVTGNIAAPAAVATSPNGKPKKRLIIGGAIAAAILLIGGSAGAYFGVVVPNKPENLWKKALSNTAKGYDTIVSESQKREDTKGAVLKGTFKIETADVVVDGNVETKLYEKNSSTKLDIGAAGTRVSLEALTTVPAGASNPDLYLRATGLKGIGQLIGGGEDTSGIGEALQEYDNKWYVVDHTLFDQLEKSAGASTTSSELTKQDITAVAQAVGTANKQYLLTTEPDKAVLKVAEEIGKEEREGRSVYHYKVGYNKDNLKKYVTSLRDELKKTKLGEVYKTEFDDTKMFDESLKEIDELKGTETADVYVDTKTKLIRVVRIVNPDKQDDFFEIALNYNGGDEYPFVLKAHETGSEESDFELGLVLNSKKDDLKANATFSSKSDGETVKASFDSTVIASNEKVEFTKPEGAQSLTDLLGGLFGSFGSLGAQSDLAQECPASFEQQESLNGEGAFPQDCVDTSSPLDVLGAFDDLTL